jgi:hypothetical protein
MAKVTGLEQFGLKKQETIKAPGNEPPALPHTGMWGNLPPSIELSFLSTQGVGIQVLFPILHLQLVHLLFIGPKYVAPMPMLIAGVSLGQTL